MLFGPSVIAKGIGTTPDVFTLVTYGCFTIPGMLLGCWLIDRVGRKALMAGGFCLAGLSLLVFAPHLGHIANGPTIGLLLFGVYTFTNSMGPATVSGSGILGVELAPTRIRSIAQGSRIAPGTVGRSQHKLGSTRSTCSLVATSSAGAGPRHRPLHRPWRCDISSIDDESDPSNRDHLLPSCGRAGRSASRRGP